MNEHGEPLSFDTVSCGDPKAARIWTESLPDDPADGADTASAKAKADAEAKIAALAGLDTAARRTADPVSAITALAAVSDAAQRELLAARLAALRLSGVTGAYIARELSRLRSRTEQQQRQAAEAARQDRLLGMQVDGTALLDELCGFLSARVYLPVGAAIMLALWALLTHCIEAFSTAPYLCLESALPDCGKSTVLDLLESVSARAEQCSGLTRAVLVRTIEKNHATVLLDQGEWLRDKNDEAGIMGVLLSGYRRGKPYRCVEGDSHELASFDTFGPKAFCAVGGLRGALLSRCVVLHMERLPAGMEMESAESEDIASIAAQLKEKMETFALQATEAIRAVQSARPKGGHWPQFTTRERQLWTPLLTIARAIGPEAECQAVAAAEVLVGRKAVATADDPRNAKTVALAEVLAEIKAEKFSPGDLVEALSETEAWGEVLAEKRRKDDTGKAASAYVGQFLKDFRLQSRERPHGKTRYQTAEALAAAERHMPRTPQISAATAASAARPTKSSHSVAADWQAGSAANNSRFAAEPEESDMPVSGTSQLAADAPPIAADVKQDFGQTAANKTRVNSGVAADAAVAAVKTGITTYDSQPGLFADPGQAEATPPWPETGGDL